MRAFLTMTILAAASCAGETGTMNRGDAGGFEAGGDVQVARSNPDAVTNPAAACSAVVTLGLYGTDACTPGTEVMLIRMNLAQDCYGWTRTSGRGEVQNSATRFQCYRDRLCYTQTPSGLTCAGRPEDKESRTDGCTLEPMGGLWTRIVGGTEGCPAAPAGFECPRSGSAGGTAGVAPATACGR
jgi:hypothetical protein